MYEFRSFVITLAARLGSSVSRIPAPDTQHRDMNEQADMNEYLLNEHVDLSAHS